jgi:hypothetical protein
LLGGVLLKSENLRESKEMETKVTYPGQPCRKCSTPVIRQEPKKRNPKKSYWYAYYLLCPNKFCKTMYMIDAARIDNPAFKAKPEKRMPMWKENWLKLKSANAELENGFDRNIGHA